MGSYNDLKLIYNYNWVRSQILIYVSGQFNTYIGPEQKLLGSHESAHNTQDHSWIRILRHSKRIKIDFIRAIMNAKAKKILQGNL